MKKKDQGISTDRYKVIPRTLVFITKEDSVLLLKGSPTKKIWSNKYNGIGGHIERGEDVYQAALRELSEETGLQNIKLKLRGSIIIDVEQDLGIHLFIFQGDYVFGELVCNDEGSLQWIPLKKLSEYPLVDDLFILIPKIINEQDKMIFGRYYFDKSFKMDFQE